MAAVLDELFTGTIGFARHMTACASALVNRSPSLGGYERKLLTGIFLAMLAFVPALGMAAYSLSVVVTSNQRLNVHELQAVHVSQHLYMLKLQQDSLMPIFVLSSDPRLIDFLHRVEDEFDATSADLKRLETESSTLGQRLDTIAALEAHLRAVGQTGIAMRLRGGSITEVDDYFRRAGGPLTHALMDQLHGLMRTADAAYQARVAHDRKVLVQIEWILSAASAIAVLFCCAIGILLVRLVRAKRSYDAVVMRQAEWDKRIAIARKQAVETVAHDLKNPLHVMMITGEQLQSVMLPAKGTIETTLQRFTRSAEAMRRLIDSVLDRHAIENETMPVFKIEIDLSMLLREVTDRFGVLAAAKGVNLVCETPNGELALAADPARLEQALSNLLANAVKFTLRSGTIRVSAVVETAMMAVTVADSGCGMDADQVAHIFERYWHSKDAPDVGSGLGLAITKAIVEAHGGNIAVASQRGAGTTFTVRLPLR